MTTREQAVDTLCGVLQARLGIRFRDSQRGNVERLARQFVGQGNERYFVECANRAATDGPTLAAVVDEVVNGETYFFRDLEQFLFTRDTVLPGRLGELGADHGLRVWSAGCSTGEEAYSLAALLETTACFPHARVLASDVSERSLTRARAGIYSEWSLRGAGVEWMTPHLEVLSSAPALNGANGENRGRGAKFRVGDHLRRWVSFRVLNLAEETWPAAETETLHLDVIFCRNVLIYFAPEVVAAVARRFYAALSDGGWLIAGPSDPPLAEFAPFQSVVTPLGVYYRRREGLGPTIFFPPTAFPNQQEAWVLPVSVSTTASADQAETPLQYQDDDPYLLANQGCAEPQESLPPWLPASAREFLAPSPVARAVLPPAHRTVEHSVAPREDRANNPLSNILDPSDTGISPEEPTRANPQKRVPDAEISALRVLANHDPFVALRRAAELTRCYPMSAEAYFWHASLLVATEQADAARGVLRQAIYLDRGYIAAHLLLGTLALRHGERDTAQRCFRAVAHLSGELPPDQAIRGVDEFFAGDLHHFAQAQLHQLEGSS